MFYKRALDSDPNHVDTLNSYGLLIKEVLGDYERAENMFKKAIEIEPNNINGLNNYGLTRKQHKNDLKTGFHCHYHYHFY